MTVATTRLLRSPPLAFQCRAMIDMITSPLAGTPSSSTAMRRSASPSKASPIRPPVRAARNSGWVAPHPSLMFIPLGSAASTSTSALSRVNSSGAALKADPLAQSSVRWSPPKL